MSGHTPLARFAAATIALTCAVVACRKALPQENVNPASTGGSGSLGPGPGTTTTGNKLPGGASSVAPTFDKGALLRTIADCAVDRFRVADERAATLKVASRVWAGSPQDRARRDAAQAAWTGAMAAWQEAEVFRMGPAAPTNEAGGQDLRDNIYSWPLGSRCRVDEQLVDRAYAQPTFPTTLVSARGLGAAEYLLFYEGRDNACSRVAAINARGTWAALDASELERRRAGYAAAVADDISLRTASLRQAWEPTGKSFRDELARAGQGSTVYPGNQDALNAVNDALFYVDVEVKDFKLARPLGLSECATATCPDQLESRFSRTSHINIARNLVSFRRLLQGCGDGYSGLGFDDWLIAAGAGDLAARMIQALDLAEAALAAVGPSLEEALGSSPGKVQALHAAIKVLTDLLKTEFITVLNLEAPQASEGDND